MRGHSVNRTRRSPLRSARSLSSAPILWAVSTPAPLAYSFEPTQVGRARVGRIMTPHGTIDTPQFLPVRTQATARSLTPSELRAAGAHMSLGHSDHLDLR